MHLQNSRSSDYQRWKIKDMTYVKRWIIHPRTLNWSLLRRDRREFSINIFRVPVQSRYGSETSVIRRGDARRPRRADGPRLHARADGRTQTPHTRRGGPDRPPRGAGRGNTGAPAVEAVNGRGAAVAPPSPASIPGAGRRSARRAKSRRGFCLSPRTIRTCDSYR